jgi:prepilin-type N-terminal cleavage/methylation domain-containing protein
MYLKSNVSIVRMKNTKKGFTLIELLIVIGILAILVAAVVVVLNPAQLLAQARDGQRMSDLDSIRSAVNLFMATATNASFTATGPILTFSSTTGPGAAPTSTTPTNWGTATISSSTAVDGNGWVKVAFNQISGGSPLAKLPIDPTQSATYQYGFVAKSASSTFEVIARLESTKYAPKMSADGGNLNDCGSYTNANCWYEVGSDVMGL